MAWRLNKITALSALAGSLTMVATTARAQDAGPLPPEWLTARVDERGQHCARHAEQRNATKVLVACGPAGVWEVALDTAGPRFVRSYEFGGDVIGFVTEPDGRLWVKLQVLEARPFTAGGTQPAVAFPDAGSPTVPVPAPTPSPVAPTPGLMPLSPAPAAPTPSPGAKKVGRVTRTEQGQIVISLGTADGVSRSDRIELSLPDAGADADDPLLREPIAVGVVTNVTEHTARVRLGLNESVPLGAFATPTIGQLTGGIAAPPRASGLWELQLTGRPFAALDELGGGALLSASIGRRFTHLHVQAFVDPLGIGDVQDKDAVAAVNAAVLASYDSQYFEMGLGFGVQTVNATDFFLQPGSGLAALQLIRLGAQDGLNISARTNIVLFHSEFQFGGMVASGQIPVTRGYWLLLNGGGGNLGYGFGELGLRVLLTGNGLAGSKFLTVTAGGAAVFRSASCDDFFSSCSQERTYGGPMAGVGGEWRF